MKNRSLKGSGDVHPQTPVDMLQPDGQEPGTREELSVEDDVWQMYAASPQEEIRDIIEQTWSGLQLIRQEAGLLHVRLRPHEFVWVR